MPRLVAVDHRPPVAVATLRRPEALNAMSPVMLDELHDELTILEDDRRFRILIVTGDGRSFSSGADIWAMREMTTDQVGAYVARAHSLFDRIEMSRVVSIAALSGWVLGGGLELALACDLRVASEDASLGLPECRIGVFSGWGGSQRLPRLVGAGTAKWLMFTGEPISAREAHRVGLVAKVVAPGQALSSSLRIAERICATAPRALEAAKEAISKGIQLSLPAALQLEIQTWMAAFSSEDRVEGMTAFLEKRAPAWNDQ